jgi:membrane-associated phospholipid phosphatase
MRQYCTIVPVLVLLCLGIFIFNEEIFLFINGDHGVFLNWTMFFFTQLGDGYTATIICLFLWLKNRKLGLAGILAIILSAILVQALKSGLHAPRPASVFDDVFVMGEVLKHRSFPSGHSATIAGVARVLWGVWGRRANWGILLVALLVGVSRINVGAHFPFDVAVGFTLGWLSAEIALKLLDWWKLPSDRPGYNTEQRIVSGLIVIGGLGLIFIHKVQDAQWFYRLIGIISFIIASYKILITKYQRPMTDD